MSRTPQQWARYLYRHILGCFYRHAANRSKEVLVLFTQHLLHHVWKPHCTLGPTLWERSWQIAVSTAEGGHVGVGAHALWGKAEGTAFSQKAWKETQEFSSSTWDYQENAATLSTEVHSIRMRSHRHMWTFWFKGKKQVTVTPIKHWCGCPESCAFSILGGFQDPAEQSPEQLYQKAEETEVCVKTSWVLPTWKMLFYFYCCHGYSSVLLNTQVHRGMKDLWACWKCCWRTSFWVQITNYKYRNSQLK